jgi:predicted hydrocarbon binding protein
MVIQPSGLYYINKMARIYVKAVEETIGPEAIKAVYEAAGVPLALYPPPNDFAKAFDFAYFSGMNGAIDQMYGQRGGRGLSMHAGRASYAQGFAEFGTMVSTGDLAFKAIPVKAKLTIGLKAIAQVFTKFSDQQTTVEDDDTQLVYTIHRCPVCWGRSSAKPICHLTIGLLEAGTYQVSAGRTFLIEEVACQAAGDQVCRFHIQKEPLD